MKYSTAKKYVNSYKLSARKRGSIVNRDALKRGLFRFEEGLKHNDLIGKY